MQFHIEQFLPYLLNRAAEETSRAFQAHYKARYGMLRYEWRVLFHLGYYDNLTASQICRIGDLHKTKVSRALKALEEKRFVQRCVRDEDRRFALLSLTSKGRQVYDALCKEAAGFDSRLLSSFGDDEQQMLVHCLKKLAGRSQLGG